MHETARFEYVEVVHNVRLHIRDWGQGHPIVLIPGWPMGNGMWDYQMEPLATHGFRAISISQRGFGQSDKPWGSYNYDVFSDDLKSLLDRLNLREVTLVGHSMGGAIGIRYLTRHPKDNRVTKLVLAGAAAPLFIQRGDYPYGQKIADVNAMIQAVNIDRPQLLTNFGSIFGVSETSINPGHQTWMHAMGMEASPWAMEQSLIALRDEDLRNELAAVTVPTMIFHGKADKVCPFPFTEKLSQGIKGSQVVAFENSGHGLFLEEKDKFNQELMAFPAQQVKVSV